MQSKSIHTSKGADHVKDCTLPLFANDNTVGAVRVGVKKTVSHSSYSPDLLQMIQDFFTYLHNFFHIKYSLITKNSKRPPILIGFKDRSIHTVGMLRR